MDAVLGASQEVVARVVGGKHVPHPTPRVSAAPLPPAAPQPKHPSTDWAPFPEVRSGLSSRFGPGRGRKGRTNGDFALNAYFLKTINNQNSLKDHRKCFEK